MEKLSPQKLAAETLKKKHGADYFKRLGAKGGANGNTGGFYQNREAARQAGRKGGRKRKTDD